MDEEKIDMVRWEYDKQNFMSKEKTTIIKGICSLLVFIHHFSQFISYQKFTSFTFISGPAAVEVFFFLAGYVTILGLEKKTLNKQESLKFIVGRSMRLYLPITIFTLGFNNFLGGILFMYCATFIAYKYLEPKYRIPFICIMNVLFIILCIGLGTGDWWYDRVLPYSFGAVLAIKKDWLIQKYMNNRKAAVLFGIALLGAFYSGREIVRYRYYLLESFVFSAFLCVCVLAFCYMFSFRNRILSFLGGISYEIFILHKILLPLCFYLFKNKYALLISVFLVTVLLAYFLHKGEEAINNRIMIRICR